MPRSIQAPVPINRCSGAQCHRDSLDSELQTAEQVLSRLSSKPAGALKVIEQLPEATVLRLELTDGRREAYSLRAIARTATWLLCSVKRCVIVGVGHSDALAGDVDQ
jgi:hypothetical protein